MAPKKIVKTLAYHPLNWKGGKKLGKKVELQKKLQLEASTCKPLPGNKFDGKLIIKPRDPKYANFKDPVKESLGVVTTLGLLTPSGYRVGPDGLPMGIGPNGLPLGVEPNGLPFNPKEDPNNKEPTLQCASKDEASICAQRKRERMKRLAMIGLLGFLFLLLFWWMFKQSINSFWGYPNEGVDKYQASGYRGRGYEADGYGVHGNGANGNGDYGNGDYGNGGTRYGSDGSNVTGGVGGDGKYRKKGQMCWFNLPCTYDSEEGYTGSREKSGKSPKLLAG